MIIYIERAPNERSFLYVMSRKNVKKKKSVIVLAFLTYPVFFFIAYPTLNSNSRTFFLIKLWSYYHDFSPVLQKYYPDDQRFCNQTSCNNYPAETAIYQAQSKNKLFLWHIKLWSTKSLSQYILWLIITSPYSNDLLATPSVVTFHLQPSCLPKARWEIAAKKWDIISFPRQNHAGKDQKEKISCQS